MKKKHTFWKVTGIAAIIGVLLCVIGLALGGKSFIEMNRGTIGVYWDDIVQVVGEHDTETVDIESVIDTKGITEIQISAKEIELEIQTTSKDQIYIEGSKQGSSIKQDGNEVEITIDGGRWNGTQDITLYIPVGLNLHQLDLEVGAGSVLMEGILAKEYELQVGAGELIARELAGDEINIDCGVGRIVLEGGFHKHIEVDCGMGEVNMKSSEDLALYNQNVNSSIGTVKIGEVEYSGIGNKKVQKSDLDRTIEINCGIGSVLIESM